MEYFSTDQNGITIVDPQMEDRKRLLESVLDDDLSEYPEVYLSRNGGLVIGYRSDGCLLWEEAGDVTRYLPENDLDTAMRIWDLFIENNMEEIDSLDWIAIE